VSVSILANVPHHCSGVFLHRCRSLQQIHESCLYTLINSSRVRKKKKTIKVDTHWFEWQLRCSSQCCW
jgi:hypothetical protein